MTNLEFLHKVTARLRHNKIWSEILSRTGKRLKNKNWIFITGCYNSGTTLLNQILSTHSRISGLPDEGVMLTDQLVRPEDFKWKRLWSECEEAMRLAAPTNEESAIRIQKQWSHFYDPKKDFLIEKSISNSLRLDFFQDHFHPNFFIHIVRNGYAVAEGIHRKAKVMEGNPYYKEEKYPFSLCAKQWVRSLEVFEKSRNELENVIEIRYEDLAENPSEVINTILDKLGLEEFPGDYFEKTFTIHEKNSRIKNMNSSSFMRLEKNDISEINKVAEKHLTNYGYKILGG